MLNPTTEARAANRPRLSPDKEQLLRYITNGLNQQEIADQWAKDSGHRVTRNAISMAMKQFQLKPAHPRARYDNLLPWRVKVEHTKAYDARMLRAAARIRAKKKVADRKADPDYKRYTSWLAQLKERNVVVSYHPKTGFVWLDRESYDDPNDLIRRPGLPGGGPK